jgi:hypothetical protein
MEQTFNAALVGIPAMAVVFLILWGLSKLVSIAVHHYRKTVWQAALYIAQERPDLLEDVTQAHDLVPYVGTAIEIAPRRHGRVLSVQTISRPQLEAYAHRLEGALGECRENLVGAQQDVTFLRGLAERKEKLRKRYLAKVRSVDAAFKHGADLFPVLHPYLARTAAT